MTEKQSPYKHLWLVVIDRPFSWGTGDTLRFEDEGSARAYAQGFIDRSTPYGTEGYIKVSIAKVMEELN